MSDLIERLRRLYVQTGMNYVQEAADEIEHLRAEVQRRREHIAVFDERYTQLEAERDELRRQLAEAELDAQRYRWLRGDSCPDHSVRWTQWEVRCWRAPQWTADLRRSALDAAIDAATLPVTEPKREPLPGLAPTHRCPACGALWRQCDDASWNLRSALCCGLCDAGRVELVRLLDEPKREPLSDERIDEIGDPFGYFQYGDAQGDKRRAFVRAIERAHGIGGSDE